MIKRILLYLIILIGSLTLFSCEMSTTEEVLSLDAPVIAENNLIISWDKVENAKSYEITINDETYNIYINYFDLSGYSIGTYKVAVRSYAKAIGYSDYSNTLKVEITNVNYTLDTPHISLINRTIYWDKITNADSYAVRIDGKNFDTTTDTSYTFDEVTGGVITVMALSNNKKYWSSNPSNEINLSFVLVTNKINILEINDTHGAIKTDSTYPGMDQVETLINKLEVSNGEYIKIANGDLFQGGYVSNMTKGRIFVDVLNELDFDCYVIGNHEFDWGLDYLADYKDGDESNGEANFPFLGANIVYKDTSTMPSFLDEYTIVDYNNLKVGIIGVIQENLTSSIMASAVEDYTFLDPVPIVSNLSNKLRTSYDCDAVIVAIHGYSASDLTEFASLSGNSRVDAVVCGHTHQSIEDYYTRSDNYQLPVIQSYTKNYNVGTITLTLSEGEVISGSMNHYALNGSTTAVTTSNELQAIYNQYQSYFDEASSSVITLKSDLSKSDLGLLMCDALINYTSADYAFVNTAGIRAALKKGSVYLNDIYQVYPFDNNIVTIKIKGSDLKELYKNCKSYLYFSDINTSAINNNTYYKIATVDFVATSEYYESYFDGLEITNLRYYARDALQDYLINKYKK